MTSRRSKHPETAHLGRKARAALSTEQAMPWHLAGDVARSATCRQCRGQVTYTPGDDRSQGRFARWRHAGTGQPECPVGGEPGRQRFAVIDPDTLQPPVPPA